MKFYFMLFQATFKSFFESSNFPIFATVTLLFAIVIALIQGLVSESLKVMYEEKNILKRRAANDQKDRYEAYRDKDGRRKRIS